MPQTAEGVGYKAEGTSQEAADGSAKSAPLWRRMVLQDLSENGPATADEIATRLHSSPLTIRPRVSELRAAGKIHDTGNRRKNASGKRAAVWSLTKG